MELVGLYQNRLVSRLSGRPLLWRDVVRISTVLLLLPEDSESLLGLFRRLHVECLGVVNDNV
jgi:hypothetical protein